jgi:hypothetical protein
MSFPMPSGVERIRALPRTIIMNEKKIANLQAQVNLLEESLTGMEELVIHLVEKENAERQRQGGFWVRSVVTAQA